MPKKRDLEKELIEAGWTKVKRKNGPHDKFVKPGLLQSSHIRGLGGLRIKEKGVQHGRKEGGVCLRLRIA